MKFKALILATAAITLVAAKDKPAVSTAPSSGVDTLESMIGSAIARMLRWLVIAGAAGEGVGCMGGGRPCRPVRASR